MFYISAVTTDIVMFCVLKLFVVVVMFKLWIFVFLRLLVVVTDIECLDLGLLTFLDVWWWQLTLGCSCVCIFCFICPCLLVVVADTGRLILIENADATPPHLDVFSGVWVAQCICFVFRVCCTWVAQFCVELSSPPPSSSSVLLLFVCSCVA